MTVHEEIDMLFAPPHLIGRPEEMAELGDVDQPEPIVKGIIDLGELVAQYLSAALPLYPRKEGVQYEGNSDLTPVSQENNPFLQLKETLKNPNKPNI